MLKLLFGNGLLLLLLTPIASAKNVEIKGALSTMQVQEETIFTHSKFTFTLPADWVIQCSGADQTALSCIMGPGKVLPTRSSDNWFSIALAKPTPQDRKIYDAERAKEGGSKVKVDPTGNVDWAVIKGPQPGYAAEIVMMNIQGDDMFNISLRNKMGDGASALSIAKVAKTFVLKGYDKSSDSTDTRPVDFKYETDLCLCHGVVPRNKEQVLNNSIALMCGEVAPLPDVEIGRISPNAKDTDKSFVVSVKSSFEAQANTFGPLTRAELATGAVRAMPSINTMFDEAMKKLEMISVVPEVVPVLKNKKSYASVAKMLAQVKLGYVSTRQLSALIQDTEIGPHSQKCIEIAKTLHKTESLEQLNYEWHNCVNRDFQERLKVVPEPGCSGRLSVIDKYMSNVKCECDEP